MMQMPRWGSSGEGVAVTGMEEVFVCLRSSLAYYAKWIMTGCISSSLVSLSLNRPRLKCFVCRIERCFFSSIP